MAGPATTPTESTTNQAGASVATRNGRQKNLDRLSTAVASDEIVDRPKQQVSIVHVYWTSISVNVHQWHPIPGSSDFLT